MPRQQGLVVSSSPERPRFAGQGRQDVSLTRRQAAEHCTVPVLITDCQLYTTSDC